ncbi:hypothetical protein Bpfe_006524, partial [Biomphalaria pfeifferi]
SANLNKQGGGGDSFGGKTSALMTSTTKTTMVQEMGMWAAQSTFWQRLQFSFR